MGLRELKKQRTRQQIGETAWRLFAERGFDQVTVAEIARQAEVAEATVFNYFPTKEDLFYDRLEAFGTRLVDAISRRDAQEPALFAFQRCVLDAGGFLARAAAGDAEGLDQLKTVNRVITDSPALLAREQQAIASNTDALAALLAAETRAPADDLTARVAANALMGVHRALIDYVRRRILADDDPAQIAVDLRKLGKRAFALLANGLGDYASTRR